MVTRRGTGARRALRSPAAAGLLAAAAFAAAPAWGAAAEAAGGGAAPAPARGVVFVGPGATCGRLAAALVSLLRDEPRIVWRSAPAAETRAGVPAPRAGLSRLWIDAAWPGVVRVVTEVQSAPPVERTIDAPELDPVAVETVAQIACETARALLDGRAPPSVLPVQQPGEPAPAAGRDLPPAHPALALAASPSGPATPSPPRTFAASAGYLVRSIFDGGSGVPPLAQGVALGAAVSFPRPRLPVDLFSSLSLEYHRATISGTNCTGTNCAAILRQETLSGVAVHGLFGASGRPARHLELGAGLGLGLARNSVESRSGAQSSVWRAAGRGEVSLAAVGLRAGLEVTAALTIDHVFGEAYDWAPLRISGGDPLTTLATLQVGGVIAVGRRW